MNPTKLALLLLIAGSACTVEPVASSRDFDEEGSTGGTTAQTSETSGTPEEGSSGWSSSTGGSSGEIEPEPEPEVERAGIPADCEEAAASPSTYGCEFVAAALPRGEVQFGDTAFVVTNVSSEPAHVRLEDRSGIVSEVDVAPGGAERIVVGPARQLVIASSLDPYGYRLVSDQVVQVHEVTPPGLAAAASVSLLLPSSGMGTRHRVVTYPSKQTDELATQYIAVVATRDDTEVTVRVPEGAHTLAGVGLPALEGDEDGEGTIVLQSLDVLVLAASAGSDAPLANDISGTLVRSDHPVAVFSGTTPAYVPASTAAEEACCGDVLAAAVPATTTWGRRYAAVKFNPRGDEPDVWRLVADHDDTTIVLRSETQDVIELDAGEVHDLTRRWSFVAEGDKPFGMVQLMSGAEVGVAPGGELETTDCGPIANPGDPAMRWVPPRRSWAREHLINLNLSASEAWCGDQLTIVADTDAWDEVRLDGAPLPAGTELARGGLTFVYVPLNTGLHTVTSPPDVGVEVTAYGYAERGGYVVPGASGLEPL